MIAAIVVVFLAHCVLQFVLYRGRCVSRWSIADSDFIVFAVPILLSLTGYAVIFSRLARTKPWSMPRKVEFVIALTLVTGFFSMWGSLLIPFNTYGT